MLLSHLQNLTMTVGVTGPPVSHRKALRTLENLMNESGKQVDLRWVHTCSIEGMSLRNAEVVRTFAFLVFEWHVIFETICVVLVLA